MIISVLSANITLLAKHRGSLRIRSTVHKNQQDSYLSSCSIGSQPPWIASQCAQTSWIHLPSWVDSAEAMRTISDVCVFLGSIKCQVIQSSLPLITWPLLVKIRVKLFSKAGLMGVDTWLKETKLHSNCTTNFCSSVSEVASIWQSGEHSLAFIQPALIDCFLCKNC